MLIAKTPDPPYYAVIFTSIRRDGDLGYASTADEMLKLAEQQPGFLGVEHARDMLGITVSYWRDLESIKKWKNHAGHSQARKKGRAVWYRSFYVRIARVEREYAFEIY